MKIIWCLIFLILFSGIAGAAGTQTINGIPLELVDYGNIAGIRATPFSSYPFSTIKVYNEDGSTTATSGLIEVADYDIKTIGVNNKSVIGDGTLTVNVNFFLGTTTYSSGSATFNVYGTRTYILPLTEYCTFLNISASTDTGTITADIDLFAVHNKR